MGAEDFAFFTDFSPCGYVRLGCLDRKKGHIFDLHNPFFDFDEKILVQGAQILAFLIMKLLENDPQIKSDEGC